MLNTNLPLVEDCIKLKIKFLREKGFLKRSAKAGTINWHNYNVEMNLCVDKNNDYLTIHYKYFNNATGLIEHANYKVKLYAEQCYYGGFRYYFLCPIIHNGLPCNEKVSTLYLPPDHKYFACRRCHNLSYKSQRNHNKRFDRFNALVLQLIFEDILASDKITYRDFKEASRIRKRLDRYYEKLSQ